MHEIITSLKSKNYRITKARIAMIGLLFKSTTPLSVEEVKSYLDKKKFTTDLVTVYRFFNTLVSEGYLRKIELGEGKYRYELATLPHHHHLICNICGSVEDVGVDNNCDADKLAAQSEFKIDHHHLEIFGSCSRCQ